MKAILLIDMPEDMRIEDTRALHLTLFNGLFTKDISLGYYVKPMPERLPEVSGNIRYFGWNACLDEILGETE